MVIKLYSGTYTPKPRFFIFLNTQSGVKTIEYFHCTCRITTDEVSADRRICKLRLMCEVAFSLVTKTKGLRDFISNDFLLLDAMNHWGHETVNLDAPLMKLN